MTCSRESLLSCTSEIPQIVQAEMWFFLKKWKPFKSAFGFPNERNFLNVCIVNRVCLFASRQGGKRWERLLVWGLRQNRPIAGFSENHNNVRTALVEQIECPRSLVFFLQQWLAQWQISSRPSALLIRCLSISTVSTGSRCNPLWVAVRKADYKCRRTRSESRSTWKTDKASRVEAFKSETQTTQTSFPHLAFMSLHHGKHASL